MTKISLYDIFTGSVSTKWLEPGDGISLDYSPDYHSIILSLSGTGPGGTIDISRDPNPTLGGNLNLNGYAIISNDNQSISIQPGVDGELILNGLTFPSADGHAGDLLGTDGNGNLVWYAVPGISNSQPGVTFYVDKSVFETGDGSKETPYKTITEALVESTDGDTIVIYEGEYVESLNISKSIYLVAIDDADVTILGRTAIAAQTTVKSTGIKLLNNVDFLLVNNGTFVMNGGALTNPHTEGAINDGVMTLNGTLISTRITSQGELVLNDVDSEDGLVTTSGSLHINSAKKSPMIDHVSGEMVVRNAPKFDFDLNGSSIGANRSIRSSAISGSILFDNISLKQDSGWSSIHKTGTCSWVLNNVGRNPQIDTLSGPRKYFVTESSDLSSLYVPSNYVIPNNVGEGRNSREASITDHLQGIDSIIGHSISSVSNVLWVAKNGSVSNNGTFSKPFSALQSAISVASSGDTIYVAPGAYVDESLRIDKNIKLVGLEFARFPGSTVEVVDGATVTFDNLEFDQLVVDGGAINVSNSKFNNQDESIIIQSLIGDSHITASEWSGRLVNSDVSGNRLIVDHISSDSKFTIDGNGSVTVIRDSAEIGHVYHQAGDLSLINIGSINNDGSGESLNSDADDSGNNFLYMNLVSTRQSDGTYGQVAKIGFARYRFGVNDFSNTSIINGHGERGMVSSDDVTVNYVAESYSSSDDLTDHIVKIDEVLSKAVIRPSRLYYVDSVDELNDIYMDVDETLFGFDTTIYITPGAIAQFLLHDNFEFKPGVNLIGTGASENVIVQMPTTIPNLVAVSADSGNVHETLWRDIKLNSPTIVILTNPDDVLRYENMTINGDITVNNGKMVIKDSKINGVINIAGGTLELWSCDLEENIIIGSGSLYINGVKQVVVNSNPSFRITGGKVTIHNLDAFNSSSEIFNITGGKTTVTSMLVDPDTYNTVIMQDVGGSIHIGTNNISIENKTVSGIVNTLNFGL